MSVATVIFLDTMWNKLYKGKTLLEHTIDRSKILTPDIYVPIDDPSLSDKIRHSLSENNRTAIEFITPDTSIVNHTGFLRQTLSAIHHLDFTYILYQSVNYPYLTSLDIMRLYQAMQNQPIEIMTYKLPDGKLTELLFTIDTTLTKRRIQEFEQLDDDRLLSFFRTSYNTTIIPVNSIDHRMEYIDNTSTLNVDVPTEVDFGELQIIRPGKHFRAFKKLNNSGLGEKRQLTKQLEMELEKWENISIIINQIKEDLEEID